jgi:DNA repair exonuclease SbcCD ATPase subunit
VKVLSIEVNNILSIEDMSLTFEDSGLVLVEGWNNDDNRAMGAGKTAIFNALSFGLYGKLPRKITATEILKKGAKTGFVEVVLSIGADTYKVKRGRPLSEYFEKNGVKAEINQDRFEAIIKLSYDQFLISMYTSQSADKKFINLNDSEKKDFLLKLMNFTEFNTCKTDTDAIVDKFERQINELTRKSSDAFAKIDAHKELLNNLGYSETSTQTVEKFNNAVLQLQQVPKPDFSGYAQLEADLRIKSDKIVGAKAKRSVLMDQYRELALQTAPISNVRSGVACPHCDGMLNIKGQTVAKADDIEALQAQHNEHVNIVKESMLIIKSKMDVLDILIAKDNEIKEQIRKLREQKDIDSVDYQRASTKIAELNTLIKNKKLQEDVLVSMAKLNSYIGENEIIIGAISTEADIYRTISQMFSPTGAPAYILDTVIEGFNESINKHLTMTWPNASYQLKTYKQNKQGDINTKFSEELIVNGKERSIGSLSGGEKKSVSLAIDFAVLDVLRDEFGIELNPIIMDEPFDGLDINGKEAVIEHLEDFSNDRQIWVVDHASEAKALFNRVFKVEKTNGTSTGSWQ